MVNDGRANLLCTDLETYASSSMDAGGKGNFCVDATKFRQLLDCLVGDMVEIDAADGQIVMRDEKSRLTLRQFTDKFPEEAFATGEPTFECEAGDFANALSFVEPCVGGVHKSFVFGAICLRVKKDTVEAWGMDGAAFAGAFLKASVTQTVDTALLPPTVASLISGITGPMKCWLTKSSIAIQTEEDFVTTRLVEGRYPDLRTLLAKQHTTKGTFTCKAGELKKALQAARIVCTGDAVAVEMLLDADAVMEVRAPNKEPGEVETKVAGQLSGLNDAATFDVERAVVAIGCFDAAWSINIKSSGAEMPWVFEAVAADGEETSRMISLQPNIAKISARKEE